MIKNPGDVHAHVRGEITDAVARALAAGAEPPLDYYGAGMFGIVFCDAHDVAWKVGRLPADSTDKHRLFMREAIGDEYEWLRDVAKTPAAPNVAKVFAFHPDQIVVERECVHGRKGGWADASKLWDLHKEIEHMIEPLGWSAPEFKEDSYIIREDQTPVLVDISMPHRIGMNLAHWIEDVLEGRRQTYLDWHTLGFLIVREEPYKTIPEELARRLLARLIELDPRIKESFLLPKQWGLSGSKSSLSGLRTIHTFVRDDAIEAHELAKIGEYDLSVKAVTIDPREIHAWHQVDEEAVRRIAQTLRTTRDWPDDMPLIVIGRRPDGIYEIVDGNHRLAAAIQAGLKTIPALEVVLETAYAIWDVVPIDTVMEVFALESPEMDKNQDLRWKRGDLE